MSEFLGINASSSPGHAGVSGNQHAGRLTSLAPVNGGRAVDRVDILNVIPGKDWTEESLNDEVSTSVLRLLELPVPVTKKRTLKMYLYFKQALSVFCATANSILPACLNIFCGSFQAIPLSSL